MLPLGGRSHYQPLPSAASHPASLPHPAAPNFLQTPFCRHCLPFFPSFSSPFFIQLNSSHPLRLSSGSFLQLVLPNPRGWAMVLLLRFATCCECLCHWPGNDGITRVSPAQDTLTHRRVRVDLCHLHTQIPSTEELGVCLAELNSRFAWTSCSPTKAFCFVCR